MIDSMNAEEDGTVTGYMCAVDWECELGAAMGGNRVFPSLEDALESLKCGKVCGIVEVSVAFKSVALQGTCEHSSTREEPTP